MSASAALPGEQIQRLVLRSAPKGHVLHVIATFPGREGGRSFLREALKKTPLASARDAQPDSRVILSLGFTYRGLERLHVPAPVLSQFQARAAAFTAGARMRSAQYLGDTGASEAARWDPCFASDIAHAVFTLHAADHQDLTWFKDELKPLADEHDVKLHTLESAHIGAPDGQKGEWVHFGLRDGLSRVAVRGWPSTPREGSPAIFEHAAGEFLLGHANNHGFNPWLLPTANDDVRRFFRNGSFGVLRKMEQDVKGFHHWVQAQASRLSLRFASSQAAPQPPCWSDYVKAKVCGRWPDGRRITGPGWDTPDEAQPTADFDYAQDPEGLGCPFGAHVRRMNPRLDLTAAERRLDADAAARTHKRPLIRRGRPYGPAWRPEAEPDNIPRGLLGLFFCASLEDQFEHLLGQWAERPVLGVDDRGNAKDPLMGRHEDALTRFSIPLPDQRFVDLHDLRAFVRTRGTVYAFYPGLPAVDLLLRNPSFMGEPVAPLKP